MQKNNLGYLNLATRRNTVKPVYVTPRQFHQKYVTYAGGQNIKVTSGPNENLPSTPLEFACAM